MYHYIEGKITELNPTYAILDCHGVGYLIHISLTTYSKLTNQTGATHRLLTHFVVKEDAHTLYGFAEEQERNLFKYLISVSGVGPNTARMMLSSLHPQELHLAIVNANVGLIKGIKGIGEKTAQRIIVDLKDKLGKEDTNAPLFSISHNKIKDEALSALVMLGFAKNIAEKAVDKVLKASPDNLSVEQLVKLALKNL